MGYRQSNHRPLRAGVAITPSDGMPGMGTLGAVARRNSDNVLVFVTNTHVVSNGVSVTQSGGKGENAWTVTVKDRFALDDENAYVYQYLPNESDGATDSDANRVGQLYTTEEVGTGIQHKSWLEAYRKKVLGDIDVSRPGTTTADIAALRILPGVTADFGVHDPDDPGANDHDHPPIPIVAPCVDPSDGMTVTCFGANTGRRVVEVSDPSPITESIISTKKPNDEDQTLFEHIFPAGKYFVLYQEYAPSEGGDSGSPVLWKDADGNYRLVGIHFGSRRSTASQDYPQGVSGGIGYAIPASLVESLLDVTFGVQAPIATACVPKKVAVGASLMLDGSNSSAVESGATLSTYQWQLVPHPTARPTPIGSPIPTTSFPEQYVPTLNTTAPDRAGQYTYILTVTDSNGAKASDTVTVTVVNTPPVAEPGWNRVVPVHTPASLTPAVTLVGGAQDDDTGHVGGMTYVWTVDSAPAPSGGTGTRSATRSPASRVILSTPVENGVEVPHKCTFVPHAIGDYVFTLTVTDPGDLTHEANVTIHACAADETSEWYDTGKTRCHENALQKR